MQSDSSKLDWLNSDDFQKVLGGAFSRVNMLQH